MKLPSQKSQLGKTSIPYAVLVGTLLLTGVAAYYVGSNARTKDRLRFDNAVQRTQNDIQNRLKISVNLLQASSGLFAASKQVSPGEFRSYISHLHLREEHPGVQGIGFSIRVSAAEKSALIAKMRQQNQPTFSIQPDFNRVEYHSILYLEPLDRRNQAAIGFDMFTESVRRMAMERARDTGEPAASGRVTLVQEIDRQKQFGFLIYVPTYRNGVIPATVAERRTQLSGFVYSPFRADDFIQGIFGSYPSSYVDFAIYSGTEISSLNLLYDSNQQHPSASETRLTVTKILNIAGQQWSIVYTSRPELGLDSEQRLVPFIALIGGLVSLLLFQVMRSQVRAWLAAEQSSVELRESEQALRQSEERFQAFMDNSPTSAWITDRDGKILYLSRTYYNMFDLPLSDVIGQTVHDIYPTDIANQFLENIRMAADLDRSVESIELAPRRDGTIGEFLVYKFPIANNSGRSLVGGVAIDITERSQAEALMRQSELRFRTMVDQAPISIQILSPDGKTIRVNQAWRDLWGITLEQLQDYNLLKDPQLIAKGIMPYIQQGFSGETAIIPPILYEPNQTIPGITSHDHSSRWVQAYIYPVKDDQGNIREVVLMHEDITERKQAEEELQESEARFRTLIETTFDGITINENGVILDANQGFATMFGYEMEAVMGKSILDFVAEDSRNLILQQIQSNDGVSYEAIGLKRDGTTFNIEVVGKAHKYKGRIVRVSALRDISKRKQLEDQLRARAEQLAEANRLKDEFLATLSHELRTPLNAMMGWTQLLITRKLDEATFQRATETIDRNTRSLAQLIEDLLDVSRIITGKLHLDMRPVHLTHPIELAIETVRSTAEAKQIQINTYLDESVGMVLGDGNRIQQIVWNLLSNAVKFTPEYGRIEVKLERINDEGKRINQRSQNDQNSIDSSSFILYSSGCAQITVTDTGQGISNDFLPYVFERFRQADGSTTRRHGGLGLGLAIVRHLVELQGGSVQVESPGVGQGSTFTVRLPLWNQDSQKLAANNRSEQVSTASSLGSTSTSLSLTRIKVLVVDDEADTRELLSKSLGQFGAEVVTVASANETLNTLTSYRPDILVSDIGLPDEDGYTLIGNIRRLNATQGGEIPAIALTAYAREEDRERALAAGFQVHLPKPIDIHQLALTINHLLAPTKT